MYHKTILVNHHQFRVLIDLDTLLIDVLRDSLGLTGAKKGCGLGICGSCMILLNDQPVPSCRILTNDLSEKDYILTVEGLINDITFQILQETFLEEGAVQCGYCTPGMLISAYALLKKRPQPSSTNIRSAMSRHLCRCTGYLPIEQAIMKAADKLNKTPEHRSSEPQETIQKIGGRPIPVGGLEKTTGRAKYAADYNKSDQLYGAVLLSPTASGLMESIDTSEALKCRGVEYVLTAKDVPGKNALGRWRADRPLLVEKRIRFCGDILALVLARTEKEARNALPFIKIKITTIPGVFDVTSAVQPDGSYKEDIIAYRQHIKKGKRTRKRISLRFFHSCFETGFIEHALLETEAAIAYWEGDVLVVMGPSQNVFLDRMEIMRILGLSKRGIRRIRIVQSVTGAAFGKHEDILAQPLAALGAWISHRPVKLIFNRKESFWSTTKRHPMHFRITSGMYEGYIRYRSSRILADTGAYSSWAPNILRKAAVHVTGPYRIPEVRVDAVSVYTNNAFSGAMRGFGATQAILAVECHMDALARELNYDPLEFRLMHALKKGDTTATNQYLKAPGLEPVLKAAARGFRWQGPARGTVRRGTDYIGYGIAGAFYGIGYGNALPDKGQTEIRLDTDGFLYIHSGAIDYGQGAATVFAQIASDTLNIPFNFIRVVLGDTNCTPDSGSTVASRQSFVTGSAVLKACLKLKEQLTHALTKKSMDIHCVHGTWRQKNSPLTWSQVIRSLHLDKPLTARARTINVSEPLNEDGLGDVYRTYSFAATCCEVRVNAISGRVRLTRVTSAHDSGIIIHPVMARGQVTGGVVMAAGMALKEEFTIRNGIPQHDNFDTYQIMRFGEIPDIQVVFVEPDEQTDTWMAKGLGEPAMLAATPAIVNAVADALNTTFERVPITPETILRKIKNET